EVFVVGAVAVIAPDGQNDINMAEHAQPRRIVLVAGIGARVVAVDIFVVIAVHKVTDVVDTAHPDHAVHHLRMAAGEADGRIGPEAGAGRDKKGIGVLLFAERQHFAENIGIVLDVAAGALGGRAPLGIPTLGVYAVHTVDLEVPSLELIGERCVHAHVLPLIETPLRGGEDDNAG